jgi:membrane-associated phospholipid phosphatase
VMTTTDTGSAAAPGALDRVARGLTEVFAPAVLACGLPVVIGVHAGRTVLTGLGWGLVATLFGAVIPYAMILTSVRRGSLNDRHIGVREQRTKPLALGLVSVLLGLVLLVLLGAPRELVALVVASFVGGFVATAVNHFWKLSVHASVAAGTTVILALTFGPLLLVTAVLVAAVSWSRVRLGDHTPAQVVAGTVLGAAIAGIVFGALR